MVSCEDAGDYDARIVRLICGDSNPAGPGIKEEVVDSPANGTYRGRKQLIYSGSCVLIPGSAQLDGISSFTLQAFIWPTLPLVPNPRTRPGLGPYQGHTRTLVRGVEERIRAHAGSRWGVGATHR